MSIFAQFKTDPSKQNDGVWFDICENDDGSMCRVKLAREVSHNKRYAKALREAVEPYSAALKTRAIKDEVAEKIYAKAFVEGCVIDWEHVQDPNGKEIEFSVEKAIEILIDPTMSDFYDLLKRYASNSKNFRDESQRAVDSKNS